MVATSNRSALKARITKKLRRHWHVKEKLKIIDYYEKNKNSINETSKKFNIQPKQLREWINKKNKLIKASPKLFKLHQGKPPKYPQLEKTLSDWITKQRQLQNPITRSLIVTK